MAAADPVDYEEMAAEQNRCAKRRACWVAHPSNWLSARQAPNAWIEMFPQAFSTQLSPSSSEKIFFRIFIKLLTPGGFPPVVLLHTGFFGADYQQLHHLDP